MAEDLEARAPEPEPEVEPAKEPKPEPEPKPASQSEGEDRVGPRAGIVNLSDASFDDLRSLGMSVTQAKRVLDYRDRLGGFDSIDDLDFVPGFPKAFGECGEMP